MDVAGRPFAEHQLKLLKDAGIRHVVYCVGHMGERVAAALGDGDAWDMRFDFARFEADACTSKELGSAIERGLTPRQRAFLLHNVASDLHRAIQAALDS